MREKLTPARLEQLTSDKEALPLVAPLAIAFAKHLGPLYLPPPPSSSSSSAANPESTDEFPTLATAAGGGGESPEESSAVAPLVPREIKDKFRKLLVAYFEALGKREQKLHLVRAPLSVCMRDLGHRHSLTPRVSHHPRTRAGTAKAR